MIKKLFLLLAFSATLSACKEDSQDPIFEAEILKRAHEVQVIMGISPEKILPVGITDWGMAKTSEKEIKVNINAFKNISFGAQKVILLHEASHVLNADLRNFKNLMSIITASSFGIFFSVPTALITSLTKLFLKTNSPYLHSLHKTTCYASLFSIAIYLISVRKFVNLQLSPDLLKSTKFEQRADTDAVIASNCLQCAYEFADLARNKSNTNDNTHNYYLYKEDILQLADKHLKGKTCTYHAQHQKA